jgi:hypothetical protein
MRHKIPYNSKVESTAPTLRLKLYLRTITTLTFQHQKIAKRMHRVHKLQKLALYTLQIQQILRIELGGNLNRRNDEETGPSSATAHGAYRK